MMFKLQTNYHFINQNLPTAKERRGVEYLYQPLLGCNAFALYRFLLNEIEFSKKITSISFSFNRLLQFLQLEKVDLEQAIQTLVNYRLLTLVENNNGFTFSFEKPLSFLQFSKSDFFSQYQQFVEPKHLESVYFFLKDDEFSKSNKSTFLHFLNNLDCLKNYKLKIRDFELLNTFYQSYQMSFEAIKLVLEFCFFKIGTFQNKYLLKIVETLRHNRIHNDSEKIKIYFYNVYQNMHLEQISIVQSSFVPRWLKENTFNRNFIQNHTFDGATNTEPLSEKEFEESF